MSGLQNHTHLDSSSLVASLSGSEEEEDNELDESIPDDASSVSQGNYLFLLNHFNVMDLLALELVSEN